MSHCTETQTQNIAEGRKKGKCGRGRAKRTRTVVHIMNLGKRGALEGDHNRKNKTKKVQGGSSNIIIRGVQFHHCEVDGDL